MSPHWAALLPLPQATDSSPIEAMALGTSEPVRATE